MLPPSLLRRVLVLCLLVLLSCCVSEVTDCHLDMVARLPLKVQDDLLVVPAGINGKWIWLVVDTGAERSTIAAAAAQRLGLPHDPRHTTRSLGIGGASTSSDVIINRLVLGGVHFPLGRLAVGEFKLYTDRGLNADGLLGADILLAFDLDIDVPGGQLTLYRARRCPDARLPWQQPVEIAGVKVRKDRLLIPFELDGVTGMAILDTGAQQNVLSMATARRLGLAPQTIESDPSVRQRGVGPAEVVSYLHVFKLLRIGPFVQHAPRLAIMDTNANIGDAVIGEQFLRDRRAWLSFPNRQIFVSDPSSSPD